MLRPGRRGDELSLAGGLVAPALLAQVQEMQRRLEPSRIERQASNLRVARSSRAGRAKRDGHFWVVRVSSRPPTVPRHAPRRARPGPDHANSLIVTTACAPRVLLDGRFRRRALSSPATCPAELAV